MTFVRTAGAPDRVYVARDDGSAASWSFPSYGDGLPHDLVHLIGEAVVGLDDGLWARVAAGADLGRIAAAAARVGGKLADKYAALGDLGGVLLSEALAAALTDPIATTADERVAALAAHAERFGAAVPARLDAAALAAARARLDEVAARWRALAPRGALAFTWPGGADAT